MGNYQAITTVCTPAQPFLWVAILLPSCIVASILGYWLQFHWLQYFAPESTYFKSMRDEQERADYNKWGFHLPNTGWVSWSCAMRYPIGIVATTGTASALILGFPVCYSQFPVVGMGILLGSWILLVQWTHWRNHEHKYDAGFLLLFAISAEVVLTVINLQYTVSVAVWGTLLFFNFFLAAMFANHPTYVYLVNKYTKETSHKTLARVIDSTLIAVEVGNIAVFSAQLGLAR